MSKYGISGKPAGLFLLLPPSFAPNMILFFCEYRHFLLVATFEEKGTKEEIGRGGRGAYGGKAGWWSYVPQYSSQKTTGSAFSEPAYIHVHEPGRELCPWELSLPKNLEDLILVFPKEHICLH